MSKAISPTMNRMSRKTLRRPRDSVTFVTRAVLAQLAEQWFVTTRSGDFRRKARPSAETKRVLRATLTSVP